MVELIYKYFGNLTDKQKSQFENMYSKYADWNAKINLISRKDIESLYLKHVLHSLSIARFIHFEPTTRILDVGTGGGFPGIPLAVLFPSCRFTLIDSIAKKINAAEQIAQSLEINNIDFVIGRAEHLHEKFDFVTARAVAPINDIFKWCAGCIEHNKQFNSKINGFLLLKGGDLHDEIKAFKQMHKKWHVQQVDLTQYFEEPYFDQKKLLYIYV